MRFRCGSNAGEQAATLMHGTTSTNVLNTFLVVASSLFCYSTVGCPKTLLTCGVIRSGPLQMGKDATTMCRSKLQVPAFLHHAYSRPLKVFLSLLCVAWYVRCKLKMGKLSSIVISTSQPVPGLSSMVFVEAMSRPKQSSRMQTLPRRTTHYYCTLFVHGDVPVCSKCSS